MEHDLSVPFLSRKMLAFDHATAFSLEVSLHSSSTSRVFLRGFTKEGPFEFAITPVGDMTAETFSFRIPDIPIMLSAISEAAIANINSMLFTCHLGINQSRHIVLLHGMPHAVQPLTWPNPIPLNPITSYGNLAFISGANPGAGAECIFTVPANQIWILRSLNVDMVSSATVANRRVSIIVRTTASETIARVVANGNQTASLTIRYRASDVGVSISDTVGLIEQIALPPGLILLAGGTIETITANIQAGDDFGAPSIFVQRFFSPT